MCFGPPWSVAWSCAWEVVSKEKFKTTGGYMCRFCKGFWKASRGGTRLLQITGWHKDKATCLQLVMDEPPEQLYNQWIRDRMESYKRVEPTEPPSLHCLVVGHPEQPGEVGAGGNPLGGKGGDPEGREPLGFVSPPCRMWESCDLFPPGLGCLWPRLRWGRGNGFSFWVHLSPLFSRCSTRHDSLIASTRRPHALAAPRTGHIREWLRLTLGFLEVPLGFWGIPRLVGLPPPCFCGVSGGGFWGPVGMRVACLLHLHSAFCAFGACMHCAAVGPAVR